ncbi:cyanate lyase C-terminal domain-containing protein [Lentinula detonsa]|uniref:Cyanate hydratase n=2 Tax=Lentinula TaxID=5352 RepID=A0AA38L6D4_9AGAR|nr:cyanate lyase C-terminal domain-containing protein [Lentinula detonsa]KAJ3787180.1 cyanate lyase C-terminal domain-containing protein [Lentinula aff. detonsa]
MSQSASIPTNVAPFSALPSIHALLLEAKAKKGLTFDAIGKAIDKDEVWVASAFYGQAKFSAEELQKLAEVLDLPHAELTAGLGDHWFPYRGLGSAIPTDPVVYRLYEGIMVYGHPIKALINEKFGDGIMSMIDCYVKVDKKPDPKGDRVVLTFDGKFLPYAQW